MNLSCYHSYLSKSSHPELNKGHVIKIEPTTAVMTPMALASFSHDVFCMCTAYEAEKKSFLSKPYLYCVSIELGLKAAILAVDCNDESKKKIESLGHNLIRAYNSFIEHYKVKILDDSDPKSLELINPHFQKKRIRILHSRNSSLHVKRIQVSSRS